MKKMLSLAAMFAVLAYASPASAEIKFSGDASLRLRGQFEDSSVLSYEDSEDDLNFAYRVRLKAAADLGSGYFFKAMLTNDNYAGGWTTVSQNNTEDYNIEVSNFYFGRMMENSHYMMGRLPLNSVNNPIFDLALYPFSPVDIPVATYNMDRIYGLNYGTKIGPGELNTTLIVLDNDVTDNTEGIEGDGIFNDGYAVHLSYKANIGDVTVEPQAIIVLTDADGADYSDISSNTFGVNVGVPAGDAKLTLSGFYTVCDDTNPNTDVHVDYDGYLFRLKGEVGPFMAWIDYNQTDNNTAGDEGDYENLFVWAQYNYKVYESAMGSFSLTPTVRYWAAGFEEDGGFEADYSRLRTELIATVTF